MPNHATFTPATSEDRSEREVARKQTFTQAGDAVMGALGAIFSRNALANNPGRGLANLDLGMATVRKRAAQMGMSPEQMAQAEREAHSAFAMGSGLCESPIERDALAALITSPWDASVNPLIPSIHSAKGDHFLPPGVLVIIPQMPFVRFRVDFMLVATKPGRWQMAALECDGKDYHQDWGKDAKRGGYLASWGIPLFRATGEALHADPDLAVREIVNFLNDWLQKP